MPRNNSGSGRPGDPSGAGAVDSIARAQRGLRDLGVGRGDRVAAYLPNIPETLVLLLACAGLGAVFSSCSPEFGARSVQDRWRQIAPKALVTVTGYRSGDRLVDRAPEVAAIRAALPSLTHTVTVPYAGSLANSGSLDVFRDAAVRYRTWKSAEPRQAQP